MYRRNQPRPLNWRGLPSSPSSFTIPLIKDESFSPELMTFLVYNRPDNTKTAVVLPDQLGRFNEDNKDGKPAGYGMPGGGLNPEWMENQEGAAIREGANESGLRITRVRLVPVPGDKNKLLILNRKTEKLVRWIPYSDGKQVSVKLKPSEKAVLNPFNVYTADVDWFNSKPREFFLNLKNELISEESCTEEDIAQFGLSINTLTSGELLKLGVDKEEVAEIGGFALLPVRLLRWMWENKWFLLNHDEDPDQRSRFPDKPTSYVYYSHIKRILQGLDIMGVA